VGVALSGGLDSSLLMWLLRDAGHPNLHAFTFYADGLDERPFAEKIAPQDWHTMKLEWQDVPRLAEEMHHHQDGPYGGVPTLGMGLVYQKARELGVPVLVDGQGLDEGWAGYPWYQDAPLKNGLVKEQLADIQHRKLPRALKYNDHASMAHSIEVRNPFLDHRVMEMGLAASDEQKVRNGYGKYAIRELCDHLGIPGAWTQKRSEQSPQTAWLRGPLKYWAWGHIKSGLKFHPKPHKAGAQWEDFVDNGADNSAGIWALISLGMLAIKLSI